MQISSYLEYLRQDYVNLKLLISEWHKETGEEEDTILELLVELLTSHSTCPLRTRPVTSPPPRPATVTVSRHNLSCFHSIPEGFQAPVRPMYASAASTVTNNTPKQNGGASAAQSKSRPTPCTGCALQDLQLIVNRLKSNDCLGEIQLSRRILRELLADINIPLPKILFPPQFAQPRNGNTVTLPSTGTRRRRGDLQIIALPPVDGLQWQDIKMTFISHESVRINAGPLQKRLHFAEMGFKDGRKGDVPDTRWAILREFAARHGVITWQDVNPQHSAKLKAAIKDIRKRLKAVFGLSTDPFYPYRKVKGYKIKLQLDDETLDNSF